MSDRIIVSNAIKVIKGRTVLDDVSFSLERGGVYGFTGINGSGKTMLLRAISGLVRLTSGTIEVFGERVGGDVDFPSDMGLVFESSGFWGEATGRENLLRLASIRGIVGPGEVDDALERVGLEPYDARPVSAYSMGMKQRLTIAQAVMEYPALLIMDEPTNSLDVGGIEMIAELVASERVRGATVLLSSHNEPDVEALYERAFRMESGRLEEVPVDDR